MSTFYVKDFIFQPARKTLAQWQSENPILREGEFGVVVDGNETEWLKVGDGVTAWNSLPFKKGPRGTDGADGVDGKDGKDGKDGNVMYATFEVNENGDLIMYTHDGYTGPQFRLNENGELEVEI